MRVVDPRDVRNLDAEGLERADALYAEFATPDVRPE